MTELHNNLKPRQQLINIKYRRLETTTLEHAVIETETRLTRISPIISDMPSAHGNVDKMTDGIAKLIDLKNKLNKMVDQMAEEELRIIENIRTLDNPIYRIILYKLYIKGDKLMQVALDISYSYEYACKLHGDALNAYDNILINLNMNHDIVNR